MLEAPTLRKGAHLRRETDVTDRAATSAAPLTRVDGPHLGAPAKAEVGAEHAQAVPEPSQLAADRWPQMPRPFVLPTSKHIHGPCETEELPAHEGEGSEMANEDRQLMRGCSSPLQHKLETLPEAPQARRLGRRPNQSLKG